MDRILAIALKDLRILTRDRMGLFWTLGFPLLIAIFFGSVFGGGGGSGDRGKMTVATVDQDNTPTSIRYLELLAQNDQIALDAWDEETAAIDAVRRGQRSAVLVVRPGFGENSLAVIGATGGDPYLSLGVDPSRSAEGGLLTGVMMKTGFDLLRERFLDPGYARSLITEQRQQLRQELETGKVPLEDLPTALVVQQFLGSLDGFLESMDSQGWFDKDAEAETEGDGETPQSPAAQSLQFDPASAVGTIRIEREARTGPVSGYEIAFPQGVCWAVIGCVMTFALGLVIERRRGTLTRLQLSPVSPAEILAGKGLACFLASAVALTLVMLVGILIFGVRVPDPLKLTIVLATVAFCFTGIMLLIAVLGRTEGAVAGAGNAALLIMAMFGGGMIPLFILPKWMATVGSISPVKWSILSLEGVIWRGFGWTEMLTPLAILLAMGLAATFIAIWRFHNLLKA